VKLRETNDYPIILLLFLHGDATVEVLKHATSNVFGIPATQIRLRADGIDIASDGPTPARNRLVSGMEVSIWSVSKTTKRSKTYMSEWRQQKILKLATDTRTHIHTLQPGHLFNKKNVWSRSGKKCSSFGF